MTERDYQKVRRRRRKMPDLWGLLIRFLPWVIACEMAVIAVYLVLLFG